jgi:D-amino-acid dehydrogenase
MALPHGHVTAWTSKRAADLGRDAASRTDWGAVTWRDLSAAELERYAPVMKRLPRAGILFNGTGQVRDPQGARDAILTQFVRQGGDVVEGNAEVIDANGRVLLARRTLNSPHFDGERGANFKSKAALENFESKASLDLKCDTSPDPTSGSHLRSDALGDRRVLQAEGVLIAAGAWSGALMRQLGQAAPLIGERGYSVQSAEHAWPEDLPTTVFEQHFVVFSRFSSGLRATSCIEFGAPSAPGDPRKWRLLEKRIAQLGVKFSKTPDRWVGPRPTLPDYVPAIGRLQRAPNVLYAFGHAHLGLTMSAVTAELIAALATERAPTIDLRAFAVERFS